MPNNLDKRSRNDNPNWPNEAERNGREATSTNQENEFYEELGRKGGEARNNFNDYEQEQNKENVQNNKKRNEDDFNSINS
ncbi:hypothetical protein SAMN05518871_102236 [Psychrobacillus sp. OK028]|uniref:hypothetical protein n=1 Tax=Psychrobacillus sp. OK028 TaxID=1884359 RepID=UPI000888A4FB|nr:hypothetical protein [Psychrobacillus sp. OK028]SDM78604.1 hypothetical protein SAMN05518871_102236 [Psychrobacillus sp. OK028]